MAFFRASKYILSRFVILFLIAVVSIYITILVASKGGVIESEMKGSQFDQGWFAGIQRVKINPTGFSTQTIPQSVLVRNLLLIYNGLTFHWGASSRYSYFAAVQNINQVGEIVLNTLPRTLLVFVTANLLVFLSSIWVALAITRKYSGWLDRLVTLFSPISSIPSWVVGLIIIVILAEVFKVFRGPMVVAWPETWSWDYFWILVKGLGPAILALFITRFFQTVYVWRSYFLTYSSEDYIDLAKAKGLPNQVIERRYILRPVFPSLLTSFAMLMTNIWQEAIVLEVFFGISGIGMTFYLALKYQDPALIVALIVVFAYLLVFSILLLDVLHVLLDPRVRVGGNGPVGKATSLAKRRWVWLWQRKKSLDDKRFEPAYNAHPQSHFGSSWKLPFITWSKAIVNSLQELKDPFTEIIKYPTAVAGLVVITILIVASIYSMTSLSSPEAIRLWNQDQETWVQNPQTAAPTWINWFRTNKLPPTIILDSQDSQIEKSIVPISDTSSDVNFSFAFDYPYNGFPQGLSLEFIPHYDQKAPYVALSWITPDGREIKMDNQILRKFDNYYLKNDEKLRRQFGELDPLVGLFADPAAKERTALPGRYELRIQGVTFEPDSSIDARLKLEGQVYGLAGTDYQGRDLSIALLYGVRFALLFGLLGALGTSLMMMTLAAVSAWFGGWVDSLVQRLTEVNMLVPGLAIFLMVYLNYTKNIWIILGLAVCLNIFGSGIKTYRSIFLQAKDAPYIEAAKAYGANDGQLIFRYLVPRIMPAFIPQLVILIPTYVFLEATLAFLNITDPLLPTWGKVIMEAISHNALSGPLYWLLEPAGLMLIACFGFLLFGFALERILNPNLKKV